MESIMSFVLVLIPLLFLGILIAFSPTIIITEIAILTRAKNPLLLSLFLITGIATPIIVLGILAFLFIDPTDRLSIPNTQHIFNLLPALNILIGAILLVAGLRLSKRLTPKNSHNINKIANQTVANMVFTPKKVYWFGCIKMGTSISSLAAIILASQLINKYLNDITLSFISFLWLLVVALAPFVLLMFLQKINEPYFIKLVHYSDKVASIEWSKVLSIVLIWIGLFFIGYGIYNI